MIYSGPKKYSDTLVKLEHYHYIRLQNTKPSRIFITNDVKPSTLSPVDLVVEQSNHDQKVSSDNCCVHFEHCSGSLFKNVTNFVKYLFAKYMPLDLIRLSSAMIK